MIFCQKMYHSTSKVNMDYDRTNIPEAYNRGRDHGPAFVEQWMKVVSGYVDAAGVRRILDLGCGTGRFAGPLARRFEADVVGLDPSRKMLLQATSNKENAGVLFASGLAEALPLRSNCIDMIFISMIFHHFSDPSAVARECRRVLRSSGRLCLRTASTEMIPSYPYVPFFPTTRPLLEQRLPSIAFQREVFESESFRVQAYDLVTQEVAGDYSAYAVKLATRADSIIASLDEEAFQAGLKAVRSAAVALPTRPVTEPIDFVVFVKSS